MGNDLKKRAKTIEKLCHNGKISPLDAVEDINELLCGITRVEYKQGKKFKIYNHNNKVSLQYEGMNKKAMGRVQHMACLAYNMAQENGYHHCGEVHISRDISSKHHKGGFYEILKAYDN
jgi:hypothetical protein